MPEYPPVTGDLPRVLGTTDGRQSGVRHVEVGMAYGARCHSRVQDAGLVGHHDMLTPRLSHFQQVSPSHQFLAVYDRTHHRNDASLDRVGQGGPRTNQFSQVGVVVRQLLRIMLRLI